MGIQASISKTTVETPTQPIPISVGSCRRAGVAAAKLLRSCLLDQNLDLSRAARNRRHWRERSSTGCLVLTMRVFTALRKAVVRAG